MFVYVHMYAYVCCVNRFSSDQVGEASIRVLYITTGNNFVNTFTLTQELKTLKETQKHNLVRMLFSPIVGYSQMDGHALYTPKVRPLSFEGLLSL